MWFQVTLTLPPMPRGFHLITSQVQAAVPQIKLCRTGLLHVFLMHTSASIAINENADPDVRLDMERGLDRIVPENQHFVHTLEGPDDMPAHIKSSLLGCSVHLPIREGELALGTWQGLYLGEHRDQAGPRKLLLTLHGEQRS